MGANVRHTHRVVRHCGVAHARRHLPLHSLALRGHPGRQLSHLCQTDPNLAVDKTRRQAITCRSRSALVCESQLTAGVVIDALGIDTVRAQRFDLLGGGRLKHCAKVPEPIKELHADHKLAIADLDHLSRLKLSVCGLQSEVLVYESVRTRRRGGQLDACEFDGRADL